jgi:hypothetical protein
MVRDAYPTRLMVLDRKLQKELLEKLSECYPQQTNVDGQRVVGDPITINLWYLEQHGLVETVKSEPINAPPVVVAAKITHRGLDFLADDGGLSAILGTVTVKFHADSIKAIFEAKIAASEISEEEKESFIEHIRSLPNEALTTATTRLVEQGLDHLPDAIQILQKLLGF